jgi:hypothetical protein
MRKPVALHVCGGSGELSDKARQEIDDFATYLRLKERFDIRRVRTAPSAETRQPVAWWIGPHDGLVAGATTNRSLADARIPHGATVRPLVFGDVAPSAETGGTEAKAIEDAWRDGWSMGEFSARAALSYHPNDRWAEDDTPDKGWCRSQTYAALTGGANHSTARVTEAKPVAWECRVDGDLWYIENDEACAMSFLENGDGLETRTITPLYRALHAARQGVGA